MTAPAVLTRAEAAGIRFRLRPDGTVFMQAATPPAPDLLAELRRYRNEVATLLAEREDRPAREAPLPPAPEAAEAAPAPADATEALAARLLHLAGLGAAALAEPDPALDEERAVMAAHYAAEPTADPYQPGDPDPLRDGLLAGARVRVLSAVGRMREACARHKASVRKIDRCSSW
jgi:hypothetical protein